MIFEAISRHEDATLLLESIKAMTGQPVVAEDHEISRPVPLGPDPFASLDRLPTLEESEDLLIQEAFKRTNGNQTLAAQLLGITRQTLHRRINPKKE